MTKRDFDLLARVFDAEIFGGLPAQVKSKRLVELESLGLVQAITETLPGRFPVIIRGWALTLAGNYAFCIECAKRYPTIDESDSGRGV